MAGINNRDEEIVMTIYSIKRVNDPPDTSPRQRGKSNIRYCTIEHTKYIA